MTCDMNKMFESFKDAQMPDYSAYHTEQHLCGANMEDQDLNQEYETRRTEVIGNSYERC